MIFNICTGGLIRPQGKFVYNGTTYSFDGRSEVNVSGVLRYLPGSTGKEDWKIWIYENCTLTFGLILRNPQICVLGPGGIGGYDSGTWGEGAWRAGCGGGGGQIQTTTLAASNGMSITVNINSTNTVVSGSASITSVKGGDGGVGGGENPGIGYSGGGTGNGGEGCAWNGGGAADAGGSPGAYAFGDSSFDGVRYGGGGAGHTEYMHGGETQYARGAGGWANMGSNRESGESYEKTPRRGAVFLRYTG